MSRLPVMLENSRLAAVIQRVEQGERVDLGRVLALQALDLARAGELFAADTIENERQRDEQLAAGLRG